MSSDEGVVSVENGVVTAFKPGSATVTAYAADGKSATCRITVLSDEVEEEGYTWYEDFDGTDVPNYLRTTLEGGGSLDDDHVVRKVRRVNEGSRTLNANIEAQAARWLDAGKIVGLVGGDHSTPYGLIRALGARHASFGILHIDAHCDLREAYEGFEYSHASIMYNVLRDIPQVTRLVQVAVRDFSATEAALAASSERIETFDDLSLSGGRFRGETWDAQCREIVERLPEEVYVSFDIDGLTLENCPHTGTPVCGGLGFNEAIWLLDTLARSGRRIIGFDLVEVAPSPEGRIDAITGARMLWKLCGLTLKSNNQQNQK